MSSSRHIILVAIAAVVAIILYMSDEDAMRACEKTHSTGTCFNTIHP